MKSAKSFRHLRSLGGFFSGTVESFSRARSAQMVINTPENAFERAGTTRNDAIRKIFDI